MAIILYNKALKVITLIHTLVAAGGYITPLRYDYAGTPYCYAKRIPTRLPYGCLYMAISRHYDIRLMIAITTGDGDIIKKVMLPLLRYRVVIATLLSWQPSRHTTPYEYHA